MKRGQMDIAPVYIIGSIIFLLVLVFGYNSIDRLRETEGQITYVKLQEELKRDVKQISSDYGSVREFSYRAPEGISEVCFADLSVPGLTGACPSPNPIASTFSKEEPEKNVFFVGSTLIGSGDVGNLDVGDCPLVCYKMQNNQFSIKLEGKGDKALLRNA